MIKTKGFTLIEVMVVIVIIGMVLAFSMPMLNSGQAKYNNTINNLMDKLNVSRQEAITKNISTTFYVDSDSFFYGSDKYIYDKRIDMTIADSDGEEISFNAPIVFNPGGTTPKLVMFQITGFNRTSYVYLMPSGYILKSNETE